MCAVRVSVQVNCRFLWLGSAKPRFQLLQRFDAGQTFIAIGTGYVEEYCLHSGASCTEIVDRVDVADVKALFSLCARVLQGCLEYEWMRLFLADDTGISNDGEMMRDPGALKDIGNFPVGVRDDGDAIALGKAFESFGGARADYVPVRGDASGLDQRLVYCLVFYAEIGEEVGVEHPPEAVIGMAAVLDDVVKFVISATLDRLPLLVGGKDSAIVKRF